MTSTSKKLISKVIALAPTDVKVLPDSYVLTTETPGIKSGELNVQIEDKRKLVISGERKRDGEGVRGVKFPRKERHVGKFMRRFVFPENANMDKVSAVYEDGVLKVTVMKMVQPDHKKKAMDIVLEEKMPFLEHKKSKTMCTIM